jgi:hypothetical protein
LFKLYQAFTNHSKRGTNPWVRIPPLPPYRLEEACKIIPVGNDAARQPMMNLVMARTFLAAQDPKMIFYTWADVGDVMENAAAHS